MRALMRAVLKGGGNLRGDSCGAGVREFCVVHAQNLGDSGRFRAGFCDFAEISADQQNGDFAGPASTIMSRGDYETPARQLNLGNQKERRRFRHHPRN